MMEKSRKKIKSENTHFCYRPLKISLKKTHLPVERAMIDGSGSKFGRW